MYEIMKRKFLEIDAIKKYSLIVRLATGRFGQYSIINNCGIVVLWYLGEVVFNSFINKYFILLLELSGKG